MRLTVPGRAVITTTPVGESDRLAQVVSDEDDRLARSIPQLEELILQEQSRLGVERAERLVHQDDLGGVHERADDVRREQPAHDVEQRRLAAAAWAADGQGLAGAHVEAHAPAWIGLPRVVKSRATSLSGRNLQG